ncbi:hypothetical protein AQF52_1682 [Streptomyces venezuelae]|uniref:DUF202 domain-containing protein n=1 Tax=Streptomyces gardneri TaxID=66892 RepID=UPI0006BC50DB|nr:DUF202 domain-containing protein [Streptomyces gardneri]ALO07278.1 hypothetical protein AQF52_1682 [Streptomyces venezuelae]QPK44621.1 DUF202 domain-containing protein [Streptomyces gardneri]WRK35924.1 DUF202 domain-containing protein [Streptomyces venezuelae]CUM42413.1 FIG01123215: hypothetical protein [Streptomyces venezuelae]
MTEAHGTGAPDPEVRDPGLQPERTRLAWRRTTLSWTVVAVLAVKLALHDDTTATGLTALALSALVWVGFLAVAHRRIRSLSTARPRPLSHRGALLAAGCTIALAVFGAALIW